MARQSFVITMLKWGGILFSATLTVALMASLFWGTWFGGALVLFALVLFEGGALGWNYLLAHSQEWQRMVTSSAMWFCVAASVGSSAVAIVNLTKWFEMGFDVQFWTLLLIVSALVVNVICAFMYDWTEPIAWKRNKEANREADKRATADRLHDRIAREAHLRAEQQLEAELPAIANKIATEIKEDVIREAREASRGGDNTSRKSSMQIQEISGMDRESMGARPNFRGNLLPESPLPRSEAVLPVSRPNGVMSHPMRPPTQSNGKGE